MASEFDFGVDAEDGLSGRPPLVVESFSERRGSVSKSEWPSDAIVSSCCAKTRERIEIRLKYFQWDVIKVGLDVDWLLVHAQGGLRVQWGWL